MFKHVYMLQHKHSDLQPADDSAMTAPRRRADDQPTAFALRMKQARKHAGMLQKDAAKAIEISQPGLSALESTAKKSAHLPRVAAVYGVSATWLQSGKGTMLDAHHRSHDAEHLAAAFDAIPAGRQKTACASLCHHLCESAAAGRLREAIEALSAVLSAIDTSDEPQPALPLPSAKSRPART